MTKTKLVSATAIVFALSFALMGCNENDNTGAGNGAINPVGSAITAQIHGAFMAHCFPVKNTSGTVVAYQNREINFLNETQYTDMTGTYAVADTSCAGAETGETSASGTYTINGNAIDFNDGVTTRYDIFTLVDANTVHFGDVSGANNGTTPALRPTTFSTVDYTFEVVTTATPTPTATPAAF